MSLINFSHVNPFNQTETSVFPETVDLFYPLVTVITTITLAKITRMYRESKELARYTCDHNGKKYTLSIHLKANGLIYKIWQDNLLLQQDTIDQTFNLNSSDRNISLLFSRCDVFIDRESTIENKVLHSKYLPTVCQTMWQWKCDDIVLKLMKDNSNFIWKAYFESTGETLTVKEPIIHIKQHDPREGKVREKAFQRICFKHFKKTCLAGLRVENSFFQDFQKLIQSLSELELTCIMKDPSDEKNLCIHFTSFPIASSEFDPSVKIDAFNWAITLIRDGGIRDNHAIIMVEGARKKERCFFRCELKDENEIGCDPRPKKFYEKIHPAGKTPTWRVSAVKAQKMVTEIVKQKKLTEKGVIQTPFSYWGIRAHPTFGGRRAHNCLTWAQEMLRIAGIHLVNCWSDCHVALASNYTKGGVITEDEDSRTVEASNRTFVFSLAGFEIPIMTV